MYIYYLTEMMVPVSTDQFSKKSTPKLKLVIIVNIKPKKVFHNWPKLMYTIRF